MNFGKSLEKSQTQFQEKDLGEIPDELSGGILEEIPEEI